MHQPFLTKWPFLFKLRLFFILLGLISVAAFLYLKVVPTGQIVYERDYEKALRSGKGFVYGFTPAERVDSSGAYPRLVGDPVYFSLFTPRTFTSARVLITYRDRLASKKPLIELGVLKDKIARNYDLQPAENRLLDNLDGKWSKATADGVTFWQKAKNYSDLAAFQKDLAANKLKDCADGPTSCVAVYNYSLAYDYRLSGIKKDKPLVIDQPLRGEHQFYVYVSQDSLALDFSFLDMNQDKGQDPISVNLYYGGDLIDSGSLDDNNPDPTGGITEEKSLSLAKKNLQPGVYKAEIKISDDVVIKKITSSSSKLSFINRIWPVSASGSLTLYTDTAYLLAKAFTPASLQTINFNNQSFALDEPYQQFEFVSSDSANSAQAIRLAKDDVILENNGVFSWAADSLFNPNFPRVDSHLDLGEIKYIVADYQEPVTQDDWKIATIDFSLLDSYRENGKYSFLISVPGLKEGSNGYLEIKSIRVELSGRTWLEKLKSLYEQD